MTKPLFTSRATSQDAVVALLLALFVFLFLLPILGQWHPAIYDDGRREMLPGMIAVARSLQSGSLPLWDFCTFAGARPPYASNFLLNFYPPMYPFFLLADTEDPVQSHFCLMLLPLVLHLMWAAVGGFLFGRLVLKLRRSGAFVLGLLYALSPEMGCQLTTIPPGILFSHLPWCMLALTKLMETGRARWWFSSVFFLTLMSAVGCANYLIRVFFMMSVTVGMLWLLQLRDARAKANKQRKSRFGPSALQSTGRFCVAATTFVLAIGLNGFAWAGLVEGIGWMSDAVTMTPEKISTIFNESSMPLQNLITLFIPELFGVLDKHGWGICTDCGINALCSLPGGMFVMVAAVFACFIHLRSRSRRGPRHASRNWTLIAATLLVLFLLIIMGRFTPVFGWFCNLLPWFFRFPHPTYYRFVVCWNFAILVGIGVSALGSKRYSRQSNLALKILLTCMVAGLVGIAVALFTETRVIGAVQVLKMRGYDSLTLYGEWGWFISRPMARFVVSTVLIVGALRWRKGRWREVGFTAGIAAETAFLAFSVFYFDDLAAQIRRPPSYKSQPRVVLLCDNRLACVQDEPQFKVVDFVRQRANPERVRYTTYFSPYDNYSWYADGRALFGYSSKPLIPYYRKLVETCTEGAPYMLRPTKCTAPMLRNMNVGYFVEFQGKELFSHTISNPLPYVYTQNRCVSADDDRQFERLMNSDLRGAVYVRPDDDRMLPNVVSFATEDAAYESSFAALQKANVVQRVDQSQANRTLIEVTISEPAMLVISECWHEGWTARIDGIEKKVHRVNYLQQGVWLEPGHHVVELSFFPSSVRKGFLVSAVSACVLLIVAIAIPLIQRYKAIPPGVVS